MDAAGDDGMNAIKESFDNLPAAICILNAKGLVWLMNRRMLAVSAMLLGSGIQTLGELREALQNPPKAVTDPYQSQILPHAHGHNESRAGHRAEAKGNDAG